MNVNERLKVGAVFRCRACAAWNAEPHGCRLKGDFHTIVKRVGSYINTKTLKMVTQPLFCVYNSGQEPEIIREADD